MTIETPLEEAERLIRDVDNNRGNTSYLIAIMRTALAKECQQMITLFRALARVVPYLDESRCDNEPLGSIFDEGATDIDPGTTPTMGECRAAARLLKELEKLSVAEEEPLR